MITLGILAEEHPELSICPLRLPEAEIIAKKKKFIKTFFKNENLKNKNKKRNNF